MKHQNANSLKLDMLLAGLVFLITLILLMTSCKHDPLEEVQPNAGGETSNGGNYNQVPCDSDSVYFQNTILPLIISNCAKSGCHDANTHEEGLVLTSYDSIYELVEAGYPLNSELIEVITESDPDDLMPPPTSDTLTSAEINTISRWIEQGANNNSCVGNCDTTNVTYSAKIAPLIQQKCTGCHNSTTASANINLTSHAGLRAIALNGRLMGSVSHTAPYKRMPPGGKLPSCEIDMIRIWIDAGAPNN